MNNNDRSLVRVKDGRLVVEGFSTTDAAIVSHFKVIAADDAERELDRTLALGVHVAELAGPMLSVELVQRKFEETARRQGELLEESRLAIRQELASVLAPLFGNDGSVPDVIRQTREEIEKELTKHFDDDSAKSISRIVGQKVDEAIRASERRIQSHLSNAFDLSNESGGIGRVYKAIRADSSALNAQLTDILSRVSALVARKDERSCLRGRATISKATSSWKWSGSHVSSATRRKEQEDYPAKHPAIAGTSP
jgi:hypothetical protein